MADLDELLKESLKAEAAQYRPVAEEPGRDFMRRYRRRRSINAVVAGVFAAGALAGIAIGARTLSRPSGLGIGPEKSPSSKSAIPWVDATPTPEPLPPTTAQAPASWPPCTRADLTARFGFGGAATGHLSNDIMLANSGSTPCALQGIPALHLIDRSGREISSKQTSGSFFPDNGNERVAVRPGVPLPRGEDSPRPGIAVLLFEWMDCNQTVSVASVDVVLPNGGGTLRVPVGSGDLGRSGQGYCGNPSATGSSLGVDHFASVAPSPPEPPDYSGLSATITAPSSVKAGNRLRYEVTVTNDRSSEVAFDPCPAYIENVSGMGIKVSGRYLLNCSDAGSIPAGTSLTFEMSLDIPASTPAGQAFLYWNFEGNGLRTPKGTPITIVSG